MYAFFGKLRPPEPEPLVYDRICRHCDQPIARQRFGGYFFWVSLDSDMCDADPLQVRPFGGEHLP